MENIKEMLRAAYDRGEIDERKNRTNDRLLEEGAKAIEEERTFESYWQQLQNKQDIGVRLIVLKVQNLSHLYDNALRLYAVATLKIK